MSLRRRAWLLAAGWLLALVVLAVSVRDLRDTVTALAAAALTWLTARLLERPRP